MEIAEALLGARGVKGKEIDVDISWEVNLQKTRIGTN